MKSYEEFLLQEEQLDEGVWNAVKQGVSYAGKKIGDVAKSIGKNKVVRGAGKEARNQAAETGAKRKAEKAGSEADQATQSRNTDAGGRAKTWGGAALNLATSLNPVSMTAATFNQPAAAGTLTAARSKGLYKGK